jgi:oligoendopeptidase F
MTSFQTGALGVLPARADVPDAYTWSLEELCPTREAWEAGMRDLEAMIDRVAAFRGTLGGGAAQLLAWLRFSDDLGVLSGRLGNYAFRRHDEDTGDVAAQEMIDRVMRVGAEHAAAVSWFVPELVRLGRETVERFIADTPELALYAHALRDILRMERHTLSEPEERLLAQALEPTAAPATIFGMFNDADIRFGSIPTADGEVEVTKGRYVSLQESQDRAVRARAFEAMYGVYDAWKNTTAAMLSGHVKREMFYARARSHEDTRHASLVQDNIPVSVYDTTVASITARLAPLHRSIALRARMLGIERVRPWDLFVPLTSAPARSYAWDEAAVLVRAGMAPLGEDYGGVLSQAFSDRWIDVYENRGKSAGAYSAWTYGAHPFILMNYTGTLKDVFTLAHELGHAMHSWYTWKAQPPVYGDYTIFCAEVASTTNEMLLVDHMLRGGIDRDLRLHLLLHQIETIRGTVYNQVLFAEFEQRVHAHAEAGGALTATWLSELMDGLYRRYYGDAFEMHPLFAVNWSRIPHFYRSFYVYQYATGLSAAALISRRILDRIDGALDRYLAFLRSGNSKYSIELLQEAGVDFTTAEPFEAVAALMDALLDEVEQLL